jgi:allophanate hydrolase subunit 2
MSHLEVVGWGIAGSVRDAGRPGRAALGAARGGAVDVASLALANRLVGNAPGVAGIETSGGTTLRVGSSPVMVAVAGAVATIHVDDGPPIGWGVPVVVPPDAVIRIGRLLHGTRLYVAVRGGLLDPTDDRWMVGPDPARPAGTHPAPRREPSSTIRVWPGPRLDWFVDDAWTTLTTATFHVTALADRVGMRLAGATLARAVHRELPSEGMVEGAVQVPADGAPIVMLADHPVTGGYPVIAVVDPGDLGQLVQLAAGSTVRFSSRR